MAKRNSAVSAFGSFCLIQFLRLSRLIYFVGWMWSVGYVGPITDELWVVSRLNMYRGLLIDCTSCWLLSLK